MAGRWLYRVYCKQRAYEGASRGIAMGCGLPLLVVRAPRPDVAYVRDNELKFPASGAAEVCCQAPKATESYATRLRPSIPATATLTVFL